MSQGISLAFTYKRPDSGSNAGPPLSPPPSTPEKMIVPVVFGGSYIPLVLNFRNVSSALACASGVRRVNISSVRFWRTNGGGLVGNGCVSAVCSPSREDVGTLRYSIGKSG